MDGRAVTDPKFLIDAVNIPYLTLGFRTQMATALSQKPWETPGFNPLQMGVTGPRPAVGRRG